MAAWPEHFSIPMVAFSTMQLLRHQSLPLVSAMPHSSVVCLILNVVFRSLFYKTSLFLFSLECQDSLWPHLGLSSHSTQPSLTYVFSLLLPTEVQSYTSRLNCFLGNFTWKSPWHFKLNMLKTELSTFHTSYSLLHPLPSSIFPNQNLLFLICPLPKLEPCKGSLSLFFP